jgi:hypothetical protein
VCQVVYDADPGTALLVQSPPEVLERALPLLDAAVRQFEAIGMPGWIRRAEALRRELGV